MEEKKRRAKSSDKKEEREREREREQEKERERKKEKQFVELVNETLNREKNKGEFCCVLSNITSPLCQIGNV